MRGNRRGDSTELLRRAYWSAIMDELREGRLLAERLPVSRFFR